MDFPRGLLLNLHNLYFFCVFLYWILSESLQPIKSRYSILRILWDSGNIFGLTGSSPPEVRLKFFLYHKIRWIDPNFLLEMYLQSCFLIRTHTYLNQRTMPHLIQLSNRHRVIGLLRIQIDWHFSWFFITVEIISVIELV